MHPFTVPCDWCIGKNQVISLTGNGCGWPTYVFLVSMPNNNANQALYRSSRISYSERFDLLRHLGMSVLTFLGSKGSDGILSKLQSSLSDPLSYTTHGMLVPYATRTAITVHSTKWAVTLCRALWDHLYQYLSYMVLFIWYQTGWGWDKVAESLTEHWSTELSNFDEPKQKLLHLSNRYVRHQ